MEEEQKKLDNRIAEIAAMSDERLIRSFEASVEWHYAAIRDMRIELARNLETDLWIMRNALLKRMVKPNTGKTI